MELSILKKANELSEKLEEYNKHLKRASYTQSEDVAIRDSYFEFNGIEYSIKIPKELFKVIGKIIEAEYVSKIKHTEDELKKL